MAGVKEKLKLLRGAIRKDSPLYVQFAVSKNCDLRCRMCQAVESRRDEQELALRDIEKIAEVLAELSAGVLVLTGGEPLLRKDLPQIVEAFTKRGITVRLQTNATLATERRVEALVDAGLSEVTISLDTLDPVKQDMINGSPGSWMRIMRGLSVFTRLLPLKGNLSGINIVVSRHNVTEIPDLIRFSTAIGFYASLIPVHVSAKSNNGTAFIVRAEADDFAFTASDHALVDFAYARAAQMKKEGFLVYNSKRFLRESPDFLKNRRVHWKCDSPALYFSISPEGRFLPCVDIKTDESMLEAGFAARYRSEAFRRKMRSIVDGCPGCMYACWPEVTYLCRDPFVFTERMLQGLKVARRQRAPLTHDEIVAAAEEIRGKGFAEAREAHV